MDNPFGSDVEPDLVLDDPMHLLRRWISTVPVLMTLATADHDGYPDARHVLLSEIGDDTLTFHTDRSSRKAAQLVYEPRVALAIVWPDAMRQLTIRGRTTPQSAEAAGAAYAARSDYLKQLAWMNDDALARRPQDERRSAWSDFAEQRPAPTLLPPASWVGYDVVPERLTFWRGDEIGPSNRIEYTRSGSGWNAARLPG